MTRVFLIASILASAFGPGRALWAVENDRSAQVVYLEDKTDDLKDAVANQGLDQAEVHAMAQRLFEQVPEESTTRMPAISLRGWQKPDLNTQDTVDGMVHRVGDTLAGSKAPPQEPLVDAYLYGEALRKEGLVTYDDGKKLGPGQLGAYFYTEDSALGISLNEGMRQVQSSLGDEFASATTVHEIAHARDHQQGRLNPVEVRKGERLAFQTEYWWLKMIDPAGEKIAWARAMLGKFAEGGPKIPRFAVEYLEHLARIRFYGDKGDFDGLVRELGYQDRSADPFRAHPDGDRHGR